VLSSGSLRLIRDSDIREALLDLYAMYDEIARDEEHIDRDFDSYLYDPTFPASPSSPKARGMTPRRTGTPSRLSSAT
jgi:hypothetical protein